MIDSIVDMFKIAISVCIAAALIFLVVVSFDKIQQVNAAVSELHRFNEEYSEIREFNSYDNKDVRPQDIVSAVMTYKGEIGIYVWNNGSQEYCWNSTTKSTPYNTVAILSVLDQSKTYRATIWRGYNGEVEGLHFRKN